MRFASKVAGLWGAIFLAHSFLRALFGGGFSSITLILIILGVIGMIFFISVSISELGEAMKRRTTRYGGNLLLLSLIALGVIFLLNFLSFRHNKRFDLTEDKAFTLEEQSLKAIRGLERPLRVLAFFEPESRDRDDFEDLIQLYRAKSKNIEVELIDPDRDPLKAKQYNVTRYGTIILEYGENRKEITESPDEEVITNAIISVTRGGKRVLYVLEGHGEKDTDDLGEMGYSELKGLVEKQNFEVKKLNLLREGKVPEEASILLVAGPQKALLPSELEAMERYLMGGGALLFLMDPLVETGLEGFVKRFGVEAGRDVVIEPNPVFQIFGGDYGIPVVSSYGIHEITRDFKVATLFPLVRSMERMDEEIDGVDVEELAMTSSDSWAEKDIEALMEGAAEFNEGRDRKGPLSVAAIASVKTGKGEEEPEGEEKGGEGGEAGVEKGGETEEREGRLVVFGDSDFLTNTWLYQLGNSDLFMNCVNFAIQEEGLIGIAKREKKQGKLDISQEEGSLLFFFSVEILPIFLLLAGATAWLRRRNR